LSHNPLDNYGAITIAGGLASCNVLTFLTLSNCEIGDAGVAALVRALPQALLELDLSSNAITALGLAHVATSLRFLQTPSLTHLNFSGNEVGPGGGAELAEALPIGTPQLERLDLRGCFLADPGVTWLSPALPLCKKLRVLHLGSNGVGDAGAAALAAVLPGCLRLKQLSLAMNSITGGGVTQTLKP
jgi:Ran GTPase-activating protein (RanGAP) involved in mRNA processing and transport